MQEYIYEGQDKEELLKQALEELDLTEDDVLYSVTKDKVGLFKKEVVKLHVYKMTEVLAFIKHYLEELTDDMGLEVSFETQVREKQITVRMYSDNNNILIGKQGKTLQALTTVVKQVVKNATGVYPYILLDVSNYKENQEKYLIRAAKTIAKEVEETKNPVTMENMNSYERRIIHNYISEHFKTVYTESEGVEPNRHIVVKPKED
ncbi:MAG: KH domain-containing protein [Bacilli bacterium]|nr:KH domain-containing protein [Bacilli bacterium]